MRSRLYRRLLDLGPGYLSSARTGSLQTALVDSVEFLDKYAGLFLPQLVVSLVGAAALATYITAIDPMVGGSGDRLGDPGAAGAPAYNRPASSSAVSSA